MTRPRWLELGGQEMAEIRELPSMKMMIEWLEWERARAERNVLNAVAMGGDAKLRAGTAIAFDLILASLNTPMAIAEIPDDDFVDPARRPHRKDDPDVEV